MPRLPDDMQLKTFGSKSHFIAMRLTSAQRDLILRAQQALRQSTRASFYDLVLTAFYVRNKWARRAEELCRVDHDELRHPATPDAHETYESVGTRRLVAPLVESVADWFSLSKGLVVKTLILRAAWWALHDEEHWMQLLKIEGRPSAEELARPAASQIPLVEHEVLPTAAPLPRMLTAVVACDLTQEEHLVLEASLQQQCRTSAEVAREIVAQLYIGQSTADQFKALIAASGVPSKERVTLPVRVPKEHLTAFHHLGVPLSRGRALAVLMLHAVGRASTASRFHHD